MKKTPEKIPCQVRKIQYDQIEKADEERIFKFCFRNEFSTFTHEVFFINWKVGGDPALEINGVNPCVAEEELTIIQ